MDGAQHHHILMIYLVIQKQCKFYGIVVSMSPGNLLEIISPGLLDTLSENRVCVCLLCRVSEEGMKIVNTLETIREGQTLGPATTLPPSYSVTPHHVVGTPVVSPYGHHRYRHGQTLINGLRSPPEMTTSRTSRVSIQSGHDSPVTDITSQIHVITLPKHFLSKLGLAN